MTTDIYVLADTLDCMADLCEDTHGAQMRTFRDSASSLRSLRAERDALAEKLRALEAQEPVAYETRWAGKGGPYAWGSGFLHKVYPDVIAEGTEVRPLYSGPVPASQDDARYKPCLDSLIRQVWLMMEDCEEHDDGRITIDNDISQGFLRRIYDLLNALEDCGYEPDAAILAAKGGA